MGAPRVVRSGEFVEMKPNSQSDTDYHSTLSEVEMPDFDNPPVVETFLSVSFQALERWGVPHFGLYWNLIRSDYPKFELRPPVVGQVETFGESPNKVETILELEFLNQPPVRCWFHHKHGNRLIQLQSDRFIFNWRKVTPEERYPKFEESIRGEFQSEWAKFTEFLSSENLSLPDVEQCEISYINHIPLDSGWRTYAGLVDALTDWPGFGHREFLPTPEDIQFNTRYRMPAGKGRLHVRLQQATRNTDGRRILQLVVTARGNPDSSDLESLVEWFDMGREWIVRGFTDFTSSKMHEVWKRRK